MNRRILDFIRQQQMLDPGDTVICGVSGGKDSMALLHILLELQDTLSITVAAAHFNHQLRGEEAQRDQDFVEEYCLSRSIPLYAGSEDVAAFAADHGVGRVASPSSVLSFAPLALPVITRMLFLLYPAVPAGNDSICKLQPQYSSAPPDTAPPAMLRKLRRWF